MPLPFGVTVNTGYSMYAVGAIYRRLISSEELRTMCKGGIHVGHAGDRAGKPVKYPFVEIGEEITDINDDALTNSGRLTFITTKVHSTAPGPEESQKVARVIGLLLERQERTLTTSPWHTASCMEAGSQVYQNDDNTYEHTTRWRLEGRA